MEIIDIETDTFFNKLEKINKTDENLTVAIRTLKLAIDVAVNEQIVPKYPEINLKEVANHDSINDCWIVLYDYIYDVTKFLQLHPGGVDVIIDYAGRDATLAFNGAGHSAIQLKRIQEYIIGELPLNERIFRTSSLNSSLTIILKELPKIN